MPVMVCSDPKSTFWFSVSVILLTYDTDATLSTGAEIAGVAVNVTSKINNIFRTIPSIYRELYHKYTSQANKKNLPKQIFTFHLELSGPLNQLLMPMYHG